jgi:hypothetical protein
LISSNDNKIMGYLREANPIFLSLLLSLEGEET